MLQIIQNDPAVPPGNIIEHITTPYHIHHPYRGEELPQLEQISAMIVLGGSMGANDDATHPFLSGLKTLVRTIVDKRIPYLGICLGGQLLAAAMGAAVVSNRWQECGTNLATLTEPGVADKLFAGIAGEFVTFQWHHDSFDLPADGLLLAASTACPHQAFRLGDNAWGLQFHPEITKQILIDWCAGDRVPSAETEQMVMEFSASLDAYRATSHRLVHNFLAVAEEMPPLRRAIV